MLFILNLIIFLILFWFFLIIIISSYFREKIIMKFKKCKNSYLLLWFSINTIIFLNFFFIFILQLTFTLKVVFLFLFIIFTINTFYIKIWIKLWNFFFFIKKLLFNQICIFFSVECSLLQFWYWIGFLLIIIIF